MKIRSILYLVACIGFFSLMVSTAGAYSVTLDSVDNAGWYNGSLDQSYLRLFDEGNTLQWSYDGGNLLWSDFTGLVADLSDGWIGANPSGIYLGNYTIQSGGDVFGSPPPSPIWTSLGLPGGQYQISLDPNSRAYNIEGYNDPNYLGSDKWNAYVQMWTSDGQSLAFGGGGSFFGSEADALTYYQAASNNISLYLASNADLFFYINDNNSLDNIGSVTLNIQASTAPIPATFPLLFTGLATLAASRIVRKRKMLEAVS